MLRVAIKGVLARKLRLLLTSIAVVLGVGFVSGAFILTDSLRSSFDDLFSQATRGIDVQVQTKEYKELAKKQVTAGQAAVPIDLARVGMPQQVVDQIGEIPGVHEVAGTIYEVGALPLDKHGKPLVKNSPSFGANWIPDAQDIGALTITQGRAPKPGEVMLDEHTLAAGKYHVGDDVRFLIQSGRKDVTFRISGKVRFGTDGNLYGASISVFETKQAQDLFDLGDRFSSVNVKADHGVTQEQLRARIGQRLGATYDVITGKEFAKEQTETIDTSFLSVLQNVILGFAAIAVFVGAFTIFNTFTILIGQRTREFGLLRAVGSSRQQILAIVIVEALVLGVVASTAGIGAGYGIAALLRTMINAFTDGGFPTDTFELRSRTVVASYVVGVVVTLIACVVPAWRASRLSPMEALRSNSAHAGRGWRALLAGALLCAVGAALITSGLRAEHASISSVLTRIGGGFALVILGIALLSRWFILPVTRVAAVVFARGGTGELAVRNVTRNRARSATTASALMIGLALASLVLVFYASLGATIERQIDETLGSNITIYNSTLQSTGSGTIEQSTVDRLTATDGVRDVTTERTGGVAVGSKFRASADLEGVFAFDDGALRRSGGRINIDLVAGSPEPGTGVLVEEQQAKRAKVGVGDRIELAFPTGVHRKFRVVGIYDNENNPLLKAPFVVSKATFDEVEPSSVRAPAFVYVRPDDGVASSTVVRRLKHDLGKRATYLEIQDSDDLRETFSMQLQPILALILGMLSLSLIIALFGIGNTLALNVFERTREIGLLRAVGATQQQIRRLIRVEAVLLALFGAFVGVLVGFGAGVALIHSLGDQGFIFSANPLGLAAVLVAGFIAGLLASVLPARRAARTDVLAAIAAE